MSYKDLLAKVKNESLLAQNTFVNGVDNDIKDTLKGKVPQKFTSFKEVHDTCVPGDYVFTIVKHKVNGTRIIYGRAKYSRPWRKEGVCGISCGTKKAFYFNDVIYDIEELWVYRLKEIKIDWTQFDE